MKKKLVRWLLVILVVLVVAYVGIGYVVYDKLSKVTPHGGVDVNNTPADYEMTLDEYTDFDTSAYFMPEYEEVRFPSRQDGLNLAAWYIPGEAGAPAVIITHGLNGCKCSPRALTVAGMLNKHGFNVLIYDMREHGESDIEDGRAAIG